MKSLSVMILVIMCEEGLMYPSPLKFKVHKPDVGNKTGVEITWDAMEDWDEKHPIIGYKLVVWVNEMYKFTYYQITVGTDHEETVDTYHDPKPESLPDIANPTIIVTSADKRVVIYNDFEDNHIYEFAVFPFTNNGEGPISDPYKLVTSKKYYP